MVIFRLEPPPPLNGPSNAGGVGKTSRLPADIWLSRSTLATVYRAVYRTDGDASVNIVYHSQHGRSRRREGNGSNRRRLELDSVPCGGTVNRSIF